MSFRTTGCPQILLRVRSSWLLVAVKLPAFDFAGMVCIRNTASIFEDVAAPGTCCALPVAPAKGMHGMNPRAALILSETEVLQPVFGKPN